MRRVVRENGDKEMLLHACALSLGLLFCGSYDQGLTDELFALIGVAVLFFLSRTGEALRRHGCGNRHRSGQLR